ncbi:hypothetical protein F3Y22_tig00110257pilonHSYRG00033 [Hibiscus syriacus]|uniref:PPM-type phosphatase domain-containing protein n=1 Tax=Hibiscus syriacus TaxID=106335 RepID=A0A6A3B9K8_HIBSY|nr:hypothetical protein F3Y22_tig00110257pilonHSYRG00033 [Hibiscus syriacus]
MVHLLSFLDGLAISVSMKKGKSPTDVGRQAAEAMAKDAKKNELVLSNSSDKFDIRFSKSTTPFSILEFGIRISSSVTRFFVFKLQLRIQKGEGISASFFALQLAKSSFLASLGDELDTELNPNIHHFDIWKQSYLKTYADIDLELKHHPGIDSFRSGTTALTIIKQGEHLVIANVGDSRAVLATTSVGGKLVPLQLTVDFQPRIPGCFTCVTAYWSGLIRVTVYRSGAEETSWNRSLQLSRILSFVYIYVTEEAERIRQCNRRVFSLRDEPGVYRVWMPNGSTPGLALSRAIGDHCVKEFGLISEPDVTQRNITNKDKFVILATDGVWDVISNEEAVEIVSSTEDREKSAKKLVQCAIRAWKYKKRGIAMDDISVVCLFFHPKLSRNVDFVKASAFTNTAKLG